MPSFNRRSFLRSSLLLAGASLAAAPLRSAQSAPIGANGAIRIGVIGLNGKGRPHLKQLLATSGVRVTALCDVDPAHLQAAVNDAGPGVFATTDARRLLERSDVDAVVIATGNHWHALLTVWACQAGKDVYVEKPVSRTIWEGRQMVKAARRYGRVVQAGTQYRSETGLAEARAFVASGALGRIQYIHTVAHRPREPIGRTAPWYPDGLDYDLFCGPAPMAPLTRTQLHYDWHWMWATGNGDLGNNGIHVIDVALAFAGHRAPPRRVLSLGGRFAFGDAGETPNTQLAVYDYADVPVFFEFRNLPAKPGVNFADQYRGQRTGVVVQCEGGYVSGLVGAAAYDRDGKRIQAFAGDGGKGHMDNFLAAVRSRRSADLAAPVDVSHVSTVLCHAGNLSYRTGAQAPWSAVAKAVEATGEGAALAADLKRHVEVHGVDVERHPFTLGEWLTLDGDTVAGVGSGDPARLAEARFLEKETQRPPYVIPETV